MRSLVLRRRVRRQAAFVIDYTMAIKRVIRVPWRRSWLPLHPTVTTTISFPHSKEMMLCKHVGMARFISSIQGTYRGVDCCFQPQRKVSDQQTECTVTRTPGIVSCRPYCGGPLEVVEGQHEPYPPSSPALNTSRRCSLGELEASRSDPWSHVETLWRALPEIRSSPNLRDLNDLSS